MAVNGGDEEWLLTCCDAVEPEGDKKFIIHLACSVNTVTAYYALKASSYVRTSNDWLDWASYDWSELCSDPPQTQNEFAAYCPPGSGGTGCCNIFIVAATTATECPCVCQPCDDPEPPPPSDCCSQSLWFCLNGDSQQLAVNGGTYTWNVTDCCTCTAATFEVTLSCNESTDVITLQYEFDCDGVIQTGAENTLMSTFCTGQAPQIITFLGLTCFLQLLVTIVQFDCATCEPTATTPPPP
jgi:hypothetical protein